MPHSKTQGQKGVRYRHGYARRRTGPTPAVIVGTVVVVVAMVGFFLLLMNL